MTVFLNGAFVSEARARVSVFDRGFLYGDGLFETLRVARGRLFRWDAHLRRLQAGAEHLRLRLPFPSDRLLGFAEELIRRNRLSEGLLRLTVTRGVGHPGYSPAGARQPTVVMSVQPLPRPERLQRWRLVTASRPLDEGDPLARFKTCNKLPQVLARAEAEAVGAEEALLLNTAGLAVEAAAANLFWIDRGVVCTPPLSAGVLPGVTRAAVLELCRANGLPTRLIAPRPQQLRPAQGVFLTLSSRGIVEVTELDGRPLSRSPLTARLWESYRQLLRDETA